MKRIWKWGLSVGAVLMCSVIGVTPQELIAKIRSHHVLDSTEDEIAFAEETGELVVRGVVWYTYLNISWMVVKDPNAAFATIKLPDED